MGQPIVLFVFLGLAAFPAIAFMVIEAVVRYAREGAKSFWIGFGLFLANALVPLGGVICAVVAGFGVAELIQVEPIYPIAVGAITSFGLSIWLMLLAVRRS